ncbi:putative quinol monooxygenase [Aspergillus undulatus]|uniref:putative quinol monooxygenase n=1 Tax=Aspergillus undulatus TaxID=1810928 RepID=UPI003CCD737F
MATFHGISIQMTVTLKPEDVRTFWDAFRPVFEKVTAEPECTFFEVYQSEEPGTISWTENWHAHFYMCLQHCLRI